MACKEKIELFCQGALYALLWSEELEGEAVETASEDKFCEFCARFCVLCEDELDALAAFQCDRTQYRRYGQEFVLTWNGHGTGFWDMHLEYEDTYSRLTINLLTLPLHLYIREMSYSLGKIDAGNIIHDDGEATVAIDVPRLVVGSKHFDWQWQQNVMDKWSPCFKRFVLRHIEKPKSVRKRPKPEHE
jgi:hypothetical protein